MARCTSNELPVAGVLKHCLLFDMDNFVDDGIEKIAIVGDEDQRSRIALQPLLQPDHRIEIEVVGRFIEQQQIGAADQRLGELRRIRQPPEKSLTGRSSCSLLKPRPCSRLAARERIVQASMASSLPWTVAIA